ncbi:helix-turn-helix transcriptional regulator [Nitrospirillum amazonense]|nr:helix-turn-helix transcriptional regulator [Nitrospirillum amazonense]MDG3439594.1 helix-turn-helix transcriptional regulator [Nitrospirillum amazonense]
MAPPFKPKSAFAERLITARGGMKRIDAAEALDLAPDTLGTYERGTTEPSISTLARISSVYDVSLHWLLTGEGEMRARANALQQPVAEWGASPAPLDRDRLRSTLLGFCDAIRHQPGILDMPPEKLTDFFLRGYEWLGSASEGEKARMANSVKGMTDREAG